MEDKEVKPFDEELEINQDLSQIKTKNKIFVVSNEPKLNYVFMKPEDVKNDPTELTTISRDQIDYGVVVKKGDEDTLDETKPLSYVSIKNPDDGEKWYRDKYPELPDDFYGIIARYTWGQPQTKKSIKNEKKKYEKKKNKDKPPQGLSVLQGKFEVKFD